jgi:hypothetical protein
VTSRAMTSMIWSLTPGWAILASNPAASFPI